MATEQAKQPTVSVKLPKDVMKMAKHAAIDADMSVSDLLSEIIVAAYNVAKAE